MATTSPICSDESLDTVLHQFPVIGFDLGTKTGWCEAWARVGYRYSFNLTSRDHKLPSVQLTNVTSGMWDGSKCHQISRFRQFQQMLEDHELELVDVVGYERVHRWMSSNAAEVYCGMRGLMLAHARPDAEIVAPTATQLKKYATGNGRASKQEMMKRSAEMTWLPDPEDDNEADAQWAMIYAAQEAAKKYFD